MDLQRRVDAFMGRRYGGTIGLVHVENIIGGGLQFEEKINTTSSILAANITMS